VNESGPYIRAGDWMIELRGGCWEGWLLWISELLGYIG
jgi:hypothetical protein